MDDEKAKMGYEYVKVYNKSCKAQREVQLPSTARRAELTHLSMT